MKFQGTTWKAVSAEPVPVGAAVTILGQEGLVLQVERPEIDRVEEELKALEGLQGVMMEVFWLTPRLL